jgi:hypothetical protein
MKYLIFILLFVIEVFAFNVRYGGIENPQQPVFCGKEGHLYDISEPDMWEEIVKKAKEVNETYFYSLMQKAFNKAFIVNNNLPICPLLTEKKFEPIYVVKHDIYANGVLLYKKGYMINVLERLNQLMSTQKPLFYFGSLDNNLSKKIGLTLIKKYKNAIFAVTKGDIKELAYKYPYKIAKADKLLLQKFHIQCNDTITILGNKYVYNILIPINKLTKDEYNLIMRKVDNYYHKFYKEIEK